VYCRPVTGVITFGLERIDLYVLGLKIVFDMAWTDVVTYGDIYHENEVEFSAYNFEHVDTSMLFRHFDDFEKQSQQLLDAQLPLPAYDYVLKASHTFNLLDARKAISVTERARYIGRIRDLSRAVAQAYYDSRESLGFPRSRNEGDTA
jgi:glycyl-tRNA synthetase alpha chain